jgi:hypothetical protein
VTRVQLLSSVLVVGGILLSSPVGSAQTRGFGVVSGEVKSESGEQVTGVSVKFMLASGEPLTALVGKDGKWRAVGVGKGEWKVQVAAPGYTARTVTVVVEQEAATTNSIVTVLKKAPAKPS